MMALGSGTLSTTPRHPHPAMNLFCFNCSTYIPSANACPTCGYKRPPLLKPAAPDTSLWQADLQGRIAARITLADIDNERLLFAGWGHTPRMGDTRPEQGAVVALDLASGEERWECELGLPVEGGATAAADRVLVGFGKGGMGGGEGWVAALEIGSGKEHWRSLVGGNIRSRPAVHESLVFVTADDGRLYCLDLRRGKLIWDRQVHHKAVPTPASPALITHLGALQGVITATYGARSGRIPGAIVTFDKQGRELWRQEAEGYVRGAPVPAGDVLYVSAFRQHPSAGVLQAYRLRTGRPLWPQPFVVETQIGARSRHEFSAAPLLHHGMVYVTSLDHHLYAVDAHTGTLQWQVELPRSMATQPVWVKDLLIAGCNDGKVHAIDPAKQEIVWSYDMGAPVLANPLVVDGNIVVGAENGRVAVLPWHLGHYARAAERLAASKRFDEAGDAWALAAHYASGGESIRQGGNQAISAWGKAGNYTKIAHYWKARNRNKEAATAFQQAGERLRMRDPRRAALAFAEAMRLFFNQRQHQLLNQTARDLSQCAGLPCLHLLDYNARTFIIGEPGRLSLRLQNEGKVTLPAGIQLWAGGGLESEAQAEIQTPMPADVVWTIPIDLIPTQRESLLRVEISYPSGNELFPQLHSLLEIPIQAKPPRQKPIEIGDVHTLHVTIAASTEEGIAIETRDVAVMKSEGDVGEINIERDAGAVISRQGGSTEVHVQGDVGFIRGKGKEEG